MMKKILNEWKRFVLKEGNQPLLNELFGALEKGFPNFFGNFFQYTDVLQGQSIFKEWEAMLGDKDTKRELDAISRELQQKEKDAPAGSKEQRMLKAQVEQVSKEYTHRFGGNSYGVNKYYPGKVEQLIRLKIQNYVNLAPKEEVEFLFSNLERFVELAKETKAPHSQAPTDVAFYGRVGDWWMFGDGFGLTVKALQDAKKKFIKSQGKKYKLPPAFTPTEKPYVDPGEEFKKEQGEKATNIADFFSKYADQLQTPKRKRRRRK